MKITNKVESNQEQKMVESLITCLEEKKYVVVIDNFFSYVQLFELLEISTYSTWIVKKNWTTNNDKES